MVELIWPTKCNLRGLPPNKSIILDAVEYLEKFEEMEDKCKETNTDMRVMNE